MATKKVSSKKLKTWTELKRDRFRKDPEEAIEYLNASFEENSDMPEVIAEAIRVVSESLGLSPEQIAKKANMAASTIHKALGKSGNPTLGTLTAVLKTMGLKITVKKAS
jgi:probable addiction module antidote protein